MTETVAPAPGIDMRWLKPGTTILLGSESHVYEMKVMYPVQGIVEISSTDAPLRLATVGQFLHSSHWLGGNVLSGWIGKGLAAIEQVRRPSAGLARSARHSKAQSAGPQIKRPRNIARRQSARPRWCARTG